MTTQVVEEAEYEGGDIVEISRNFFVQAADGTVCYYGEDVDIYEDGKIVSHDGAWKAGDGKNEPGIIMPGDPAVGTKFYQESAPEIAEDMSAIVSLGDTIKVPAGEFSDTLRASDWNPLEGETVAETKYYVKGIGLAVDAEVELTSYDIPE